MGKDDAPPNGVSSRRQLPDGYWRPPCKGSKLFLERHLDQVAPLEVPDTVAQRVANISRNDPEGGGTQPTEFDSDRKRLTRLFEVFVRTAWAGECDRHPLFGHLTPSEWLRWGYRHADHHLRQFGV